jgi:EAL domain-containing protein (putative c-di-GMP-specific phosphodiesterase class I)
MRDAGRSAVSIDDFGSGYSSLSYLCRFPIDKLKIDRSFIQNMHSAPQNLAVTNAIIGLGHTLGLQVVAEGVEREADAELLRAAGCDELQGFYYSRALPPAEAHAWMVAHAAAVEDEGRLRRA